MATKKQTAKKEACCDALRNLNGVFLQLIEANCWHEASYVLGTMRDITSTVDDDYYDEDDD